MQHNFFNDIIGMKLINISFTLNMLELEFSKEDVTEERFIFHIQSDFYILYEARIYVNYSYKRMDSERKVQAEKRVKAVCCNPAYLKSVEYDKRNRLHIVLTNGYEFHTKRYIKKRNELWRGFWHCLPKDYIIGYGNGVKIEKNALTDNDIAWITEMRSLIKKRSELFEKTIM